MYVYWMSEPALWTVGYYDPIEAVRVTESDHGTKEAARDRVIELNGGVNTKAQEGQASLVSRLERLQYKAVKLEALKTEREGWVAENEQRTHCGHAQAYVERDFDELRGRIEALN